MLNIWYELNSQRNPFVGRRAAAAGRSCRSLPGCGRHPHQRESARDQMRRATKAEARLDEGKPAVATPRGRLLIALAAPGTGGRDAG